MNEIQFVIYCGVGVALFFDFVNGFHDSANSVATVIGTKVLKPIYAVGIAALANFAGPFLFGTAGAATVGKGIIQPEFSTVSVILAGLIGAIAWDAGYHTFLSGKWYLSGNGITPGTLPADRGFER